MTQVRIEIESEIGTSGQPARVLVYERGQLVAEVVAEVELKQGANGGSYHCVTLRKHERDMVGEWSPPQWNVIGNWSPPQWGKQRQ